MMADDRAMRASAGAEAAGAWDARGAEAPAAGEFDVIVIGGGPAGMAAGVAARQAGANRVLIVERESRLGGVLPQCVHDGFGLHLYGESLTGPEYAERWAVRVEQTGVHVALESTVLGIRRVASGAGFAVDAVGAPLGGHAVLSAASVVVASGCRERTRGQMMIPGTRSAGVMTAGTAQYMINVMNQLPGDEAVILGSGDIGLIMARRLTLEGARVKLVLGQAATGLLRNHIRCIQDFGLPIRYGWGVADVRGCGQLSGVVVAPMREGGGFDMDCAELIPCNLLLIACGLIPEREVMAGLSAGPEDGLFTCGNANVPHDLADQVTQEGLRAGQAAAQFSCKARARSCCDLDAEDARLLRRRVVEPKGRVVEVQGRAADGSRLIPCTECPTGCMISAHADGTIDGYTCERGLAFAQQEIDDPKRLFTGTVRVKGGSGRLVSVRTSAPVSRDALLRVGEAVRGLSASAPVSMGDVLAEDVAGTGVSVVATESVRAAAPACSDQAKERIDVR